MHQKSMKNTYYAIHIREKCVSKVELYQIRSQMEPYPGGKVHNVTNNKTRLGLAYCGVGEA